MYELKVVVGIDGVSIRKFGESFTDNCDIGGAIKWIANWGNWRNGGDADKWDCTKATPRYDDPKRQPQV